MSASTITVPIFVSKPNIADEDFLPMWDVVGAGMKKLTYLELKTDIFSTDALDTEIFFNNAGIIDGDPRLTYDPGLNVMSLGGTLDMTTNNVVNAVFDSTSNVWRTSGTSTLTALTTISRSTNNLDLDNLLITDTLITSSVNLVFGTGADIVFDDAIFRGIFWGADGATGIFQGNLIDELRIKLGGTTRIEFTGNNIRFLNNGSQILSSNSNVKIQLEVTAAGTAQSTIYSTIGTHLFDEHLTIQERVAPVIDSAGFGRLYVNSTGSQLEFRDDGGNVTLLSIAAGGGYLPLAGGTLTGNITIEAKNIITDTTTGMQLWTAAAQKGGFWGAAPIVQPSHIADPAGGGTVDAEARTAINAINALLASTGLSAAA